MHVTVLRFRRGKEFHPIDAYGRPGLACLRTAYVVSKCPEDGAVKFDLKH